jgi:hypothetical protein
MRTLKTLPQPIEETERLWILMSDGVRLSARLWKPVDAHDNPVPGIVEMIPYRSRDLTAVRDSIHHPYMAGHGYACLRVDLRGSGDSDGVLTDEYLERELQDVEEVLAWLADQPWCSGRTGIMGISWGGFNGLQVAARRPQSLGAVVTVCSTDDRYTDDVHYMGGCLLTDNLSWASTMFAYNSAPPDTELVGDQWREMWHNRLDNSGLWLETWLQHQRKDDYWRHGSINEDYSDVQVPVFAASGWADGYSNAVFRLLRGLDVPTRGLIGPWSHKYPHLGQPGPAIGFLQEVVAWWDHWLKDRTDNGAMDGPQLSIWMQDTVSPATTYEIRPGRWVGERTWPSSRIKEVRYPLARRRILEPDIDPEAIPSSPYMSVQSPLSVGLFGGKWCSYNAPPDMPYDQREEDGGALLFDTDPLHERLELLGQPVLELTLATDQPVAMVAVRLSDVTATDAATRVSYGLLNLTHFNGSDDPQPIVPGEFRTYRIALNGLAQSFPPGHRLRVSISTSYWPVVWPSPRPVRLTIDPNASALILPVRPQTDDEPEMMPVFGPPEGAEALKTEQLVPGEQDWSVSRNLVDLTGKLRVIKDLGVVRFNDIDLDLTRRAVEEYTFKGTDPNSVRAETDWVMGFQRDDVSVYTYTKTVLTSTEEAFHLYAELDAYEGETRVASKTWNTTIERDFI